MKEAFSIPIQGWDPIRIVSQIIAFQTLQYLILSTLIPPMLAIMSSTSSIDIGDILDWREIAFQFPTTTPIVLSSSSSTTTSTFLSTTNLSSSSSSSSKPWIITFAWILSSFIDIPILVLLIRRPKHLLDHLITFHLIHLIVTSWISNQFPTCLFWWLVMLIHAGICIVWSEQLAIQRELNRSVGWNLVGSHPTSNSKWEMELSRLA